MRGAISALSLAALALSGAAPATAGEFSPGERPPADARPGQCFGRVSAQGPDHRSVEHVRVRGPATETRWAPAVTRWSTRRDLVKAAWTETVKVPAVYRTVVEVKLEPGPRHTVMTPPRYRRVSERVLVAPARVVWRRGHSAGGFAGGGEPGAERVQPTGEVMCRVVIAARYAVRTHLVQVAPGCRCEVEGPPVRRRIVRRELVSPERTLTRQHAAVYRTVRTCEIVKPGHSYTVAVPARYRTIEHVRHVERHGWSPVVCPDGLAPWAMARLQAALNAQGYEAGPEDGQGRPETYRALARWQRAHGLPAGQITTETARALGVIR